MDARSPPPVGEGPQRGSEVVSKLSNSLTDSADLTPQSLADMLGQIRREAETIRPNRPARPIRILIPPNDEYWREMAEYWAQRL